MCRRRHKKSVETALPELRVTTPTNSDKFSTPKLWRTETSLELVPLSGRVVNWSSRTASDRYYVLMMICCLCCFLT